MSRSNEINIRGYKQKLTKWIVLDKGIYMS